MPTFPSPAPLAQAYAHNDYLHERPLLDALELGFTSVEADVWLVDGELLVARDPAAGPAIGTLARCYLEPLVERVRRHGGTVHPQPGGFQLTVDIRSDLTETYHRLEQELDRFAAHLTEFTAAGLSAGPITVVATVKEGNLIAELMARRPVRHLGYDARPPEIGAVPRWLAPMISDYWFRQFDWDGAGPMPAAERAKLREFAATARRDGQQLRFWGTPDEPSARRDALWAELLAAGIGFISTDDLPGLAAFLRRPDLAGPAEPVAAAVG
jgi:hypothetical protein